MEKAIRWRPLIPHPLRRPARQAGDEYDLTQSAFVTLALRYVLSLLGKLPEKFELEGVDLDITRRWSLPVLARTLEEDRETPRAAVRKATVIREIAAIPLDVDADDNLLLEAAYDEGWNHHREHSLAALEALGDPGATGGDS